MTTENQQGETAPTTVVIDVAKGERERGGESSDDGGRTDQEDEFKKKKDIYIYKFVFTRSMYMFIFPFQSFSGFQKCVL